MRPSIIANRTSYAPGSNPQTNSAATQARLLEKKKEYDGVAALDRASTQYLERVTQIAEQCEIMSNAGECHGQVLAQWMRMVKILNLFREAFPPLFVFTHSDLPLVSSAQDDDQKGEQLVRLPIEDLDADSSHESQQR
ncbi:hypothetical protein D9758_002134 [Tetrapyrgos nigripes]|uniref:DASH complex subunit DAD2 n=1 Tax=Tetrapyrgos nigripes TaxID=182062 RepID=A0A8H5GTH0_9AGAR|nr:hypothetical protein D9758_002134 [Tetrapyrgos nigripes]